MYHSDKCQTMFTSGIVSECKPVCIVHFVTTPNMGAYTYKQKYTPLSLNFPNYTSYSSYCFNIPSNTVLFLGQT